ncbi:signal recognition particle-docking protein FtsY [Octadecabacter sp. 1_MG-2023]|nr:MULTISPECIES: signal recognition particle-docking protein FtsY [unclassified Octadecabacter]MBU2992774.1 signal recognition particle-docking protein FtsY [Octadecabacter sp. B2R22]MDO6733775.1 signal recognition particle-docking protein FtsY [Octadecabacter sp. 1_MG-2023]
MAFFKKLKDRLFKSSSRIEDGLDAIVSDGGVEESVEVDLESVDDDAVERAEAEATAAAEAEAKAVAEAEAAAAEAQAAAEEQAALQAQADAEEARRAEEAKQEELKREADAAREAQIEQDRLAAESAAAAAKAEAEAQNARDEQARRAEQLAAESEAAAKAEAQAAAAEAERQAAERVAEAERVALEAKRAQDAQAAEEARRAEEAQQAAEAKLAKEARLADEAREAEEARVAEAARQAEDARKAADAREAENAKLEEDRKAQEAAAKPGLIGRLLGRGEKKTVLRRELDDDMLEQLEELLITADMGVDTALRVTANMAEGRFGKKLSTQEIKELLASEVARIMEPVARPMPLYPTKPQVVLVVGVNGSGKTTTIGKLASQFQAAGKKVVIAAGDTFRAAAVEQLQVWGERAGVPVLTAPEGSDPASLAYDAMEQAAQDGADLLMIDTAGRLQNRADLMEELSKIVRVIRKKDPDAPHNTLLVLDATTGQNALSQVKTFQELADVSGLVMTKLDGTAKGGVLVALADKFGLPIHAIGVGEQIDDLAPFDPEEFAAALTGLDR